MVWNIAMGILLFYVMIVGGGLLLGLVVWSFAWIGWLVLQPLKWGGELLAALFSHLPFPPKKTVM